MNKIELLWVYAVVGCISSVLSHDRFPPGVNPTQYNQQPHHHEQQHIHQQQTQYGHGHQPMPSQQHAQQQHIQQQQHQVPVQQHQIPQQQQHQIPQQQPPQQQHIPQQQQIHQQHQPHAHAQQNLLDASNIAHEKDHIQEHLSVPIDTSKMSEQELQFHYFKMHDADNNNKLDGCELIKSLIHWHDEQKADKIFSDEELTAMVEQAIQTTDVDFDGYITWPEYVMQMRRQMQQQMRAQQYQQYVRQQQMQQKQRQQQQQETHTTESNIPTMSPAEHEAHMIQQEVLKFDKDLHVEN